MKESWKCRSGRDSERTVFLRADGRGGETSRAFSGDEGEAGERDRDVVMPPPEAAAFEMVEAELALQVLIDPFDRPAVMRR
jgi:hypothetical protein